MTAEFPIVDAHQHFWDPRVNYHPWLCDEPPIPFRYGDYRALRRPYLPAHYLSDAGPHRIIATVYVETEWDPRDPIGEMTYVEGMRREAGLPTVAVAQAWLDRDDVAAVLERQAAFSVRPQYSSQAAGKPFARRRCARRHGRPAMGRGLRAARAERPALRSADALVAPARGRRAGQPVPANDNHPQSYRPAVGPQPRRHRRMAARDGSARLVSECGGQDLRPGHSGQDPGRWRRTGRSC